jgi:hypothetical protein
MPPVKFTGEFRGMNVPFVSPGIFFITVTLPRDEELEFSPEPPTVQDVCHFVLRFPIDDFRVWWRFRASSGDRICWCPEEFDDIEDRMESAHGEGKFEAVGILSDSSFDWIGSKVAVGQFPGGSGCGNVGTVQEDLVAWFEDWCGFPATVIVPSHVILRLPKCRIGFLQCGLHPIDKLICRFRP